MRSKSSARWLREHFQDEYVQRARAEGWRSRAVYKLSEVDERDRLMRPGMTVVDLGAAPGGWSQYAARRVGGDGLVVALDVLPMDALAGVECIQGDFREQSVYDALLRRLAGRHVDLVLSDMAPNTSGMRAVDQPRAMHLVELAVEFARGALRPGGDFLVKVFQGEGFDALLRDLRGSFATVNSRKPKASRARSAELYLLARNYRL
ncbi:23S rRNA Um-2552 2'-O-methyltransferase [Plasticicumulans lactativorans]|uniref:Ribosomal RNA large subunit methyltransferase E n=1 Tax=Plasticicumulans lactativorans TaxID=1133106 RepID=A0A4V2SDE1_9GAMM|nr:23S rRNA Um-2552 2'-O-methyltransferase [Plasticicumulans lactativorans]